MCQIGEYKLLRQHRPGIFFPAHHRDKLNLHRKALRERRRIKEPPPGGVHIGKILCISRGIGIRAPADQRLEVQIQHSRDLSPKVVKALGKILQTV